MWFAEGKWCRSMLHLNKTTFIRFRLIMIYDILQYDWQTILHVHLFDAFFCVSCPRNFWRVYPQSCEHIHHVLTSRIWFSEYLTVSLVFSSHPFANKKLTRMMRLFWWDIFYTPFPKIPFGAICASPLNAVLWTPQKISRWWIHFDIPKLWALIIPNLFNTASELNKGLFLKDKPMSSESSTVFILGRGFDTLKSWGKSWGLGLASVMSAQQGP